MKILRSSSPYNSGPDREPLGSEVRPVIADRYGRFDLIPWFRREVVQRAKVLVVGAGALGNETLKNLALFGIGRIAVCDFDVVDVSNLSRSLLFSESDIGANKATAAAQSLRRINPHIQILPMPVNILGEVGTAFFGWFDVVIGAVDTMEGRLEINRACWKMNRPFIDGGLDLLSGVVKVFVPPHSSCFECTMAPEDYASLPRSNSCGLLARAAEKIGAVPTTPVSAAMIGALQVQELLKLLHPGLPMRQLAGESYMFDGLHFAPMLVRYPRKADADCNSHCTYVDIDFLPGSRRDVTLGGLTDWARQKKGLECTYIAFERDILQSLDCSHCRHQQSVNRPYRLLRGKAGPCPACGSDTRSIGKLLPGVDPAELPPYTTLFDLGLPPMDILRLQDNDQEVLVTLAGDRLEIFPEQFLQTT